MKNEDEILCRLDELRASVAYLLSRPPVIIVVNRSDMEPQGLAKAVHKALCGGVTPEEIERLARRVSKGAE